MADREGELPERVDVEEARMAVARREVRVIDVRDADDYAEARIFGSVHADPGELAEAIDGLDEDGPQAVLLVCSDGETSAELAEKHRGEGRSVSSLEGGLEAWIKEKLPMAPARDEEYEGPEVKVPGAVASETEPDEDEEGGAESARSEESSQG